MAAAYAALVSLFNNLELIQTHPRHSFTFDNKQIQSLLQIVCFLIDFMEAVDYHGGGKEAAETLERQIASAAHAAEDVIESHVVDQIHAGSTLTGEKRYVFLGFLFRLNVGFLFRRKKKRSVLPRFLVRRKKKRSVFLADVQKVIEDMELVRRKAIEVQIAQSGFKAQQPTLSAATSSAPLTTDKDKMVGFDDVLRQLLDLLTGYRSGLQVIPIVGTGGIGKTTLAKNAFQHKLIVEHFDVCLWVTISQQYVVSDILLKLLSRHGKPNTKTIGELGEELHKSLYGRRYLLVLDDMWSVEAWDKINRFFPKTSSGSRIIVTSRQSDVADYFGSLSLAMSFLKEDVSWDLFCQKAFAEQSCPPELEEAGKKIVAKCRGLPLAIVVVGGHLRTSPKSQEYWENVANHTKSILNSGEKDDQLFDVLYLSYSHLPVHLKPCFLYMGVFPEDEDISASFLIRLWIAEGFLKPKQGKTLEEVGEDCLNDLIGRNLILVVDHIRWRYKLKCAIHDVLRELCLRIAEKEKFFYVFHSSRSIHGERRVVINKEEKEMQHVVRSAPRRVVINKEEKEKEMQHVVRSAPLLRSQITWKGPHVLFDSKLLRVGINKDAEAFLKEAPDEDFWVYEFVNSRFLEFGLWYLVDFNMDSSISLLWNLQTLIVKGRHWQAIAPYEIWEMTQLRHLKCDHVYLPDHKANDLVLRNLQTLKGVVNLRLSHKVCKRIPNIKELRMSFSSNDLIECDEAWSYHPHNLGRLHKLETLHCEIFRSGPEWHEFAQALTFPSSLKKLSLRNADLDWEEITMKIGSLPLLEVLVLDYIKGGAEWNPVEGGFPRLRYLEIYECDDLRNWNAERWHFPVLEHLSLCRVTKLDELGCGIGEIATLERIHLRECSVGLCISGVRIVVEQEDNGNDNLQLDVECCWNEEEKERFKKRVEKEGLTTNNLHFI